MNHQTLKPVWFYFHLQKYIPVLHMRNFVHISSMESTAGNKFD